ncbi:DUF4253 domain-containing protein [Niabella sp. 22666]|uniref:DUF4253 domain-containing protein n=1 Tax=Niabella sp. 22666 TaxID=3453954 RepID=UPI003F85D000
MEDTDSVFLKGIIFPETNEKAYNVVFNLKNLMQKKGYTIFLANNNFNYEHQPDYIGVLKTKDQYKVLQQIKTDGINFNITNDSLITIIRNFDKELKLELIGAADDWCEFVIHKAPSSWLNLSQDVYKVCPDVVEQGSGSIEALANEMQRSGRLYLWWD